MLDGGDDGGGMILCSRVRSEGEEEEKEEEEEGEVVVWSKSPLRPTLFNHILAYNILSYLDVKSIENLTKAYPELKAKHRVEEFKFLLRRLIRNSHNTETKKIVRLVSDYINNIISYHIGSEANEMFPCCRRASNPAEDISPLLEEYMQRMDDENCPLTAIGEHCWSSQTEERILAMTLARHKISELTIEQHNFRLSIDDLLKNRLTDGKININKTLKPLVGKTDGSNEEEKRMRNSPTETISLSDRYYSAISLNVSVSSPPPFWTARLYNFSHVRYDAYSDCANFEFKICVHVIHEGPTSQLTDSLMEMLNSKYQPVRPSLVHPRVEVSYT